MVQKSCSELVSSLLKMVYNFMVETDRSELKRWPDASVRSSVRWCLQSIILKRKKNMMAINPTAGDFLTNRSSKFWSWSCERVDRDAEKRKRYETITSPPSLSTSTKGSQRGESKLNGFIKEERTTWHYTGKKQNQKKQYGHTRAITARHQQNSRKGLL